MPPDPPTGRGLRPRLWPLATMLRSDFMAGSAPDYCAVGLLLKPPAARTAEKNSSRWSWLSLYVNRHFNGADGNAIRS